MKLKRALKIVWKNFREDSLFMTFTMTVLGLSSTTTDDRLKTTIFWGGVIVFCLHVFITLVRAIGEILEQDRKDRDFLYGLFYGGEIGLRQQQDKNPK